MQIQVGSFGQEVKTVALNKYTQNEGLSSYYITKIIQDVYGFMWIGTQEGLNLFDGKNFQIFSLQSDPKRRIGGSFVSDIVEDKKRHLLWVLTSYGDVCGIDLVTRVITRRITLDKDKRPLSEKWMRSLALVGDTLWIAGLDNISGYDTRSEKYLPIDILKKTGMASGDCNISRMTGDRQGRLWLFSDGYGVVVMGKDLQRQETIRNELANGVLEKKKLRFWNIADDQDAFYAATSWGLRVFRRDERSVTYVKNRSNTQIDTAEILGVTPPSKGLVFFSTPNGFGSYSCLTGKIQLCRDQDIDDDWLTLTYQLFYDTLSQKVWLGTQSGLASFDAAGTAFTTFSRSAGSTTRIRHAFSLLPLNDDEIYCGDENGLFYIHTKTNEIEKIDAGSSNLLLFKDRPGNIFLSNKSGFFQVKGKTLLPAHVRFPALRKVENDQFSCAIQYNDSLILFGSVIQKGLSIWNVKRGEVVVFHNDSVRHHISALKIINNLYLTAEKKVYILTERSIIEFDPLTQASVVHSIGRGGSSFPFTNFMDMCETDGGYYIATYGDGILVTDKQFGIKKNITTKEGLSNNCVYKVFAYGGKSVIATTNSGMTIIDVKDQRTQTYYQSDGLHSSLFEQVCGYQLDGKIYAGGVNGFTIVDPAILAVNPIAPRLYINSITMQTRSGTTDTGNILIDRLEIPNNILQVTISLSGLNYKNPGRVNYHYKIKEDQGDWIDMKMQNFISLPSLPPGDYTLLFRTYNEAGIWNPKPISLTLVYLPKWYQTLLFKFAIFFMTTGLLYGLYRFRLRQIRKQQEIRQEIASDLHDDIGSVLNSVKIFTHLARKEPEKEDHLNQIEESLTQASFGLRDMIWVLDDSRDTIYEVMERIKKYALPVCQAANIRFEGVVKSEASVRPLTKREKRNIFLIAKETINNSIKYAECRNINVVISQAGNKKSLLITDDGKGFDSGASPTGNGLKNIFQRARQIHFIATIQASAGKGTIVLVTNK